MFCTLHQVVVCRKNSSTVHNLTSSMKKLGKSIGRSRPIGIARQVMSHKRTRAAVLREIGLLMRREMRSLCSKKTPSVLRRKVTVELLKGFRWKDVSNELRERSPVLYQILKEVLQRKRRKTKGNKPSIQVDDDLIASLCAGVILRHRNSRMSLVQRIISLLLYSEHTTKLVCIYIKLYSHSLCLLDGFQLLY